MATDAVNASDRVVLDLVYLILLKIILKDYVSFYLGRLGRSHFS